MKVKYVQKFFKRIAEIQIKYRFVFLLVLAIFSILSLLGLKKVKKQLMTVVG